MVPAPLESVIGSSPLVRDAVVFGRGRNQVGVLIEPAVPVFNVVEFRNRIWCVLSSILSNCRTDRLVLQVCSRGSK